MSKEEQSGMEKHGHGAAPGEQQGRKAEPSTVGAMLRQVRQEKGLSIRDAARETNISASNLLAIEHENYTDLPANTFIRGQVAIYGNLLGIDGAEAARKFIADRERQQTAEQKSNKFGRESNAMSAKQLSEPAHVSSVTLAFCIFLLIALFIAGFCLYTGWNPFSYLLQKPTTAELHLSPPTAENMPPTNFPSTETSVQVRQNTSTTTAEQVTAPSTAN